MRSPHPARSGGAERAPGVLGHLTEERRPEVPWSVGVEHGVVEADAVVRHGDDESSPAARTTTSTADARACVTAFATASRRTAPPRGAWPRTRRGSPARRRSRPVRRPVPAHTRRRAPHRDRRGRGGRADRRHRAPERRHRIPSASAAGRVAGSAPRTSARPATSCTGPSCSSAASRRRSADSASSAVRAAVPGAAARTGSGAGARAAAARAVRGRPRRSRTRASEGRPEVRGPVEDVVVRLVGLEQQRGTGGGVDCLVRLEQGAVPALVAVLRLVEVGHLRIGPVRPQCLEVLVPEREPFADEPWFVGPEHGAVRAQSFMRTVDPVPAHPRRPRTGLGVLHRARRRERPGRRSRPGAPLDDHAREPSGVRGDVTDGEALRGPL